MKSGDVVIATDGRTVHGAADLRNRIGLTPAGRTIRLTVKRGNDERVIAVTIVAQDRSVAALSGTPFDGATMRAATSEEAQRTGGPGVVIEMVEPGSAAARAGLRDGDLLLSVNRTPVASVADLQRATATPRRDDRSRAPSSAICCHG